MADDDLTRSLDALASVADVDPVANLEDYQSKHRLYMNTRYGRFISQFQMYFSAIADTGNNINYLDKSHWPAHRSLQFIIATHSLKQFYSSYTLLLDGAYEDAITIQRSLYESFLRVVFISLHPADAYNVYNYRNPSSPQSGTRFSATNLVNNLGFGWTTYNIMSMFAHSNMYNVVETGARIVTDGQNEAIALMYEKNDDMISIVVNFMVFLFAAYLKLFSEVFTVNYPAAETNIKRHLESLSEYKDVAMRTVKEHSVSKYWRQVGIDVEDLFRLINVMDGGLSLDWHQEWQRIRPTS